VFDFVLSRFRVRSDLLRLALAERSLRSTDEGDEMITRNSAPALLAGLAMMSAGGCAGDAAPSEADGDMATATNAYVERLDEIDAQLADWRSAATIEEAHAAAEAAANLVVGPNGPGYGDRDGDGTVGGATDTGLLPGLDGTPIGVALPLGAVGCVDRDVLGNVSGTVNWDDAAAQWASMAEAIDAWRPNRNTMPSLPSHPMRIVGWATFTLASDVLGEAHEYAGHAQLHGDVSARALEC
jgi:hypothetical protein